MLLKATTVYIFTFVVLTVSFFSQMVPSATASTTLPQHIPGFVPQTVTDQCGGTVTYTARLGDGWIKRYDAIRDFTRAIELDSGYVNALQGRGDVHFYRGDLKKAEEDYSAMLTLDSDRPSTRYDRGFARKKQNDAHYEYGMLCRKLGRNNQAVTHLKHYLHHAPENEPEKYFTKARTAIDELSK